MHILISATDKLKNINKRTPLGLASGREPVVKLMPKPYLYSLLRGHALTHRHAAKRRLRTTTRTKKSTLDQLPNGVSRGL